MKKQILKFLICLIMLLLIDSFVFGIERDSTINEFLNIAREYSKEMFPELEKENILDVMVKGEVFESEETPKKKTTTKKSSTTKKKSTTKKPTTTKKASTSKVAKKVTAKKSSTAKKTTTKKATKKDEK